MTTTKRLAFYDAKTGTFLPIASSEVYLVDLAIASEFLLERMAEQESGIPPMDHRGYRIDNFNMTNLFFGREE
jgi:hypothetical protein